MERKGHSRRELAALLAAGLVLPRAALADVTAPEPEEIKGRLDTLERLTAPVWINGQGPFSFVVDTGANHSMIADDLAESLGLAAMEPVVINTVAGAESARAVRADTLTIGTRSSQGVAMACAPRGSLGGAGLLGIEQLQDLCLTLDFRRRKLAVGAPGRRLSDAGKILVHAQQRSGRLTLVGAEVGGEPVTAFLDSGSEVTIGNPALRRLLGTQVKAISLMEAYPDAPVIGVTGLAIPGELGILPSLKVGGLSVRGLPAVFADLHTFRYWGLADEPALVLGVDLMRRFVTVDLDFPGGRVLFRLPEQRRVVTGSRMRGVAGPGVRTVRGS